MRWVYTIAGAEARAPTGDIFVNCGRPLWSGAKGKMVSAAVVACKAAVNASRQARLKEVAAWHNSAYMRSAAYSGDCHKRFSCSPTSIKPDGTPTRSEIYHQVSKIPLKPEIIAPTRPSSRVRTCYRNMVEHTRTTQHAKIATSLFHVPPMQRGETARLGDLSKLPPMPCSCPPRCLHLVQAV